MELVNDAQQQHDEELAILAGKGSPHEERIAATPYEIVRGAIDHPTNRIYGVKPPDEERGRLGHNSKGRLSDLRTCRTCGRRFWDALDLCPICDEPNP